jgi:hypothetical protein
LLSKRQQLAFDDQMLPPPSKRAKNQPDTSFRLQTPLRDEFKLNAGLDDGNESAWERSSIASGFTGQANNHTDKINIASVLPQPKHKYQLSEDVILQKEDEIMRLEEELV